MSNDRPPSESGDPLDDIQFPDTVIPSEGAPARDRSRRRRSDIQAEAQGTSTEQTPPSGSRTRSRQRRQFTLPKFPALPAINLPFLKKSSEDDTASMARRKPDRPDGPSDDSIFKPLDTSSIDTPRAPRPRRTEQAGLSTSRRSSHASAGGGFQLPKIDFKRLGIWLYVIVAGAIFLGVVIVAGLFKSDGPQTAPNAIWLGSEWTFEAPDSTAVEALTQRLISNRIGTAYAWVSFLKGDNVWSGVTAGTNEFSEVQDNVVSFVAQFREAYPAGQLYGWISLPVEVAGDYRMDDPEVIAAVAEMARRVVEDLGFDGVFLNAEPVWERYSEDFVRLLQAIRREIGDAPLAVAIPPDWSPIGVNIPKPPLIAPGTEWSREFKQRVALLTDEMAIMAYNSGLSTPPDYIEWVAYQTQAYAEAVAGLSSGARVVIGIPTYDNELPAHDITVENVASAVEGVKRGLTRAGAAAAQVGGVAIYAEWVTDNDEWRLFEQFWGNQG
jgi:hypothetical protein